MKAFGLASFLLCAAVHALADTIETFDTDPVAGGRFAQTTVWTESSFTYNGVSHALDAVLDIDQTAAVYVSSPFSALSDLVNSSFGVTFRVTDFVYGPGIDAEGYLGLLDGGHVGDFGSGLTVRLMVSSDGVLRVAARIDPMQGGSYSGNGVSLSRQETYLAVGAYTAATRQFSLNFYGGPAFGALLGTSLVTLPTNRSFVVNRIGAQNRLTVGDFSFGSLAVTIDNFATPYAYTSPVPEPSTMVLLSSLLLAGAWRRRSRRQGRASRSPS